MIAFANEKRDEQTQIPNGCRIIGGTLKRGLKIKVLDREDLRPTPDRVRETLFNWLMPTLPGAIVMRLFCREWRAWFRSIIASGASRCTFIEKDKAVIDQLQKNLDRFQLTSQAEVTRADVFQIAEEIPQGADIIFADPPFHHGISQDFLTWIQDKVQPDSRLVIEHERDQDLIYKGSRS